MTNQEFDPSDIIKRLQDQVEQESKKDFGDNLNREYLSLNPGDSYTMRFLAPKQGLESSLPWKEFYTHWIHTAAGSENVVCTQSYKNPIPCRFCEKAEELKQKGDLKGHAMSKAKHRVVLFAVNRAEQITEGNLPSLYIFELPQWYFRDFRGLLIREEGFVGMSPFNNESGYDIKITREGEGTDTKYFFELRQVKTLEGVVSKRTPLFENTEMIAEFMSKVPDIQEYKSIEFCEDEIKAMLEMKVSQKELVKAHFESMAPSAEQPSSTESDVKRSRR